MGRKVIAKSQQTYCLVSTKVLDVTEGSAIIVAIGVLIGVAYYVLEMRHQEKMRKTDLIIRLYSTQQSKEFEEAILRIWNLEFQSYDDFVNKYGRWNSETEVYTALRMIGSFYELLGILFSKNLLDATLVSHTFGISIEITWEKIRPLVEGSRKIYGRYLYYNFECLYNEIKNGER